MKSIKKDNLKNLKKKTSILQVTHEYDCIIISSLLVVNQTTDFLLI